MNGNALIATALCSRLLSWLCGAFATVVSVGAAIIAVCKLIGIGTTARMSWLAIIGWPLGLWVGFAVLLVVAFVAATLADQA